MRKLVLFVILAGLVLTLTSTPAQAQNQISLNGTSSGSITFTGTGSSNLSMTLGTCSIDGTCITGSATGTGLLASSGFFELSGGPIAFAFAGSDTWNVTSGTLAFHYNTAADLSGTDLLSGTLNLVNLIQTGPIGNFDTNLIANLAITSGSLAGFFTSAGGIGQITININGGVDLSTLTSGQQDTASLAHGAITPTPEPGTLALLGSGLVGVGIFLRRRLFA